MMTGYLKNLLLRCTANPLSAVGTILAVAGFVLFSLFMLAYMVSSEVVNPYYGALVFLGFPGFIIFSVTLILLGKLFLKDKPHGEIVWFKYFKATDEKKIVSIVVGLIVAVVAFFAVSNMQVSKFMNSTKFCGETCHEVMQPEAVAHANSVHAKIGCVNCHVGEGVEGFLLSKWRGMYQVYSLATNSYAKPIPAPVETLPSSEDTCMKCHNLEKEHADSMKIYYDFKFDKASSPIISAIIPKTGSSKKGQAYGIHAHSSDDLKVTYFASDKKRRNIQWVEAKTRDGERSWKMEGFELPEILRVSQTSKGRSYYEVEGEGEIREMDCVDCHNRVGHDFNNIENTVNDLIKRKKLDSSLPFAKAVAVKTLDELEGKSRKEFSERIEKEIRQVWQSENGSEEIGIYLKLAAERKLYPLMNIGWGTYKNFNGHKKRGEGCFRCHNQRMKDENGKNLTQDCETCHVTVADKISIEEWEDEYDLPLPN